MTEVEEIEIFSGPFFVIGYEHSGKRQLIESLSPTHQIIATDRRYPVEITSMLEIASLDDLPASPFGIMLVYNVSDMNSFLYIQQILSRLPEAPVIFLIGTHRDESESRQVSFEVAQRYKKDNALLWFEVSCLEEKEIDILRKQIFIRSVFAVRNLVEIDAEIPVKTPDESQAFPELCLVREAVDDPEVNVQSINQGSLLAAAQGQEIVLPHSELVDSIPDFQQYDAQVERAQNIAKEAEELKITEDSEEYYYDEESYEHTETTQKTEKSVKQIVISPKERQRSVLEHSRGAIGEETAEIDDQPVPKHLNTSAEPFDYFPVSAHLPSPLKARGSRLHPDESTEEIDRSRFQSEMNQQAMGKSKLQPGYHPVMQKSYIPIKASQDAVNNFRPKSTLDPSTANGYWERSLCYSKTKNTSCASKIPEFPGQIEAGGKSPYENSRYGEALMDEKYQSMQAKTQQNISSTEKSDFFSEEALEIDLEINGKTFLLAVNRDDNAYEVAKEFCQENQLDSRYIKKLALLILDRMQKLTTEEKNLELQRKRERYETYKFEEPTFRNLVMRKILFKFELTVAGKSITVAWREGDVERVIAQHILKTLSLREEEYMGFVLSKINEVVSLWKLGQHDEEMQEVY